jgi:hypothetical protein
MLAAAVLIAGWIAYSSPTQADPPDRVGKLVQVGAFTERANALKLLQKLEREGSMAFILEKHVGGKTYYAVIHNLQPPYMAEHATETRAEPEEAPGYGIVAEPEEAPGYGVVAEPEVARPEPRVTGTGREVVVPTLDRAPGTSIAIKDTTILLDSPDENGKPIGSYHYLGGGEYVSRFDKSYGIWITKIQDYGYVPYEDAREVSYYPSYETEEAPDKGADEAGTGEEVIVPLMGGEAGKSIALADTTPVYGSTEKNAEPLGSYSEVGGGMYVSSSRKHHNLWLPKTQGYGYVLKKAARKARYEPTEPVQTPEAEETPGYGTEEAPSEGDAPQ